MIRDQLKRAPTETITPPGFPGAVTVRGLMLSEVMAQQRDELDPFAMLAALVTDDDGKPVGDAIEWDYWAMEYPDSIAALLAAIKKLTPGVEQAKKT